MITPHRAVRDRSARVSSAAAPSWGATALLATFACAGAVHPGPAQDSPGGEDPSGRAGGGGARSGPAPGGSGGGAASGPAAGAAGAGGSASSALPAAPAAPASVVISELMYHPVLEQSDDDRHEFVELHNRSDKPVSLAGWKLAGDVTFTFPAGASIAANGYRVVAKSRDALAAVTSYGLKAADLLGDYGGELDNGRGTVALLDAGGQAVDVVRYMATFPWPIAADALGGGDSWVPARLLPLEKHKYLGVSLERVSADAPSAEVANWAPSPVDGATPGRENASKGTPLPIVEELAVSPQGSATKAAAVRFGQKAVVSVRISARGKASLELEWFVDKLQGTNDPAAKVALVGAGSATDLQAVLPAAAATAVVRFRVVGDRGRGAEVISPRPSDPYEWHVYAVTPEVASESPVEHLLISSERWGQLLRNIQYDKPWEYTTFLEKREGDQKCYTLNEKWDDRVPAVFVHDGKAYDVQVRMQGSYVHRKDGEVITRWPADAPMPAFGWEDPGKRRALGWSVKFPGWNRFRGLKGINLHKRAKYSTCTGVDWHVTSALFKAAGLPAMNVASVRAYVNGAYYDYMLDLELPGEDLLKKAYPGRAVGDLFKSDGTLGDFAPWALGAFQPVAAKCNYSKEQRYQATYDRKTHHWRGVGDVVKLIEALEPLRRPAGAPLRAFLEQSFDVNAVLTHIAIINWLGAWDDGGHNYYVYRRAEDQKWMMLGLDFDLMFGFGTGWDLNAARTPMSSFYLGQEGLPENKLDYCRLKDAFLRAFKPELNKRLVELSQTLLSSDSIARLTDEARRALSAKDFSEAPTAKPNTPAGICDVQSRIDAIRAWARDRNVFLAATIKP